MKDSYAHSFIPFLTKQNYFDFVGFLLDYFDFTEYNLIKFSNHIHDLKR
ncbi:hypothetical protein BACCIP111895_01252 [Neobacillus rhizosphaerae]|uniref:Uncharacterized protein n=1 Tax=Neobacillus rhizosphaerae TaxID=2880965 RepID=A0ABM9ENA0_9BACI|nr:hypothetical protein BACCIP111895_01252 [Neobacillus rhizosphaerae]